MIAMVRRPPAGRRRRRRVRRRRRPTARTSRAARRSGQAAVRARGVEDREHLARELLRAVAEDRREQLVPALAPASAGRRRPAPDLPQRLAGRGSPARTYSAAARRPRSPRTPRSGVPRELEVAAPEGDDARWPRRSRRDDPRDVARGDCRAGVASGRRAARAPRPAQRRVRRAGIGGAGRGVGAPREAPREPASAHGRRGASPAARAGIPRGPAKYSSTAVRQPDHLS